MGSPYCIPKLSRSNENKREAVVIDAETALANFEKRYVMNSTSWVQIRVFRSGPWMSTETSSN